MRNIFFVLGLSIVMAAASLFLSLTGQNEARIEEHAGLWAEIAAARDLENVREFLVSHPDSPYRADALALFDQLASGPASTGQTLQSVTRARTPPLSAVDIAAATSTYSALLKRHRIEVLTRQSPLYPPIEGLPKSMWRDASCQNCHKWDAAAFCTQAQTYTRPGFDPLKEKPHPFGVSFRVAMRDWALEGCP